ncbi:MAG: Complex I intermediate-associated protein 30 (CIA30) [Candidatus Accumulibacter sp. BA-94]|uniref:CIA30 family protein n=1 Tax=Accumulibacter sp. TaxID=2053492 RepID=UPI00044D7DF8|nr:CIA30 family protein [Accumulibacter sp.]EXI81312.1 MAG: Complex I intermediate-associated protein 30 (CIA30) [Candidatus Accumulibacter sp. BA-94]HRD89181.1 CIA30 family protein [Accumulibacter sp.]
MKTLSCRFDTPEAVESWYAIDDRVMGGVSTSGMALDREGHAVFSGTVSLANNGGFASVRSPVMASGSVDGSACLLSVRGDGKRYRFSIRTDAEFDGISYQAALQPPAGEWTILRLAAADFVPTWRGRVVGHLPPLDPACAQQIGLLIADRQLGPFKLDLRAIELVR